MADIRFHDISYAQGLYNMDLDNSPIVFMKMSGAYYGSKTPYYDVQAARNYNAAVRTGKVPGMYHFAGGGDPIVEADFFVGACSPLADGDLLILDYELTSEMSPPADPSAWCLAFAERVKERTGKYPLFYTYFTMLKQHGFAAVLERCGLWIAHYGVAPEATIAGCPPYIIHQYTSSPLDTNACFVTLETLRKYAYESIQPQEAPVTPPAVPAPTTTTTTTAPTTTETATTTTTAAPHTTTTTTSQGTTTTTYSTKAPRAPVQVGSWVAFIAFLIKVLKRKKK